jgi:hypothetical protein
MDSRQIARVNAVHHRLDQLGALLKCLRIANAAEDIAPAYHLPEDDGDPVTRGECEAALLGAERPLSQVHRALQRVLPYQDIVELFEREQQQHSIFAAQFSRGVQPGESLQPVAVGEEGQA